MRLVAVQCNITEIITVVSTKAKEFRCADITLIDYSTATTDGQYPITISFKAPTRRKILYLRAQSKVKNMRLFTCNPVYSIEMNEMLQ